MIGYGNQVLPKMAVAVLAAGSLLTVVVQGRAQESQQQQGQQRQPSSPWFKLCAKVVVAAKDQTQSGQQATQEVVSCRTVQERLNSKNAQIVVAAAISQREGEDGQHFFATVPLGMDLRSAPQARIDSGKPLKLEYVACDANGCNADAKVSADLVKAMKTGQQLVINVKTPLGGPASLSLPLAGFAAAYDGKPTDSQQYQAMREQLVNAIRARRAAQIQNAIQAIDAPQQSQTQQSPQPQSQQAPPQVQPQR
jgi:invasion protein IalB